MRGRGRKMAKTSVLNTAKFKRLRHELNISTPHALGCLEMMWMSAHSTEKTSFESVEELEAVVEWDGDPGALGAALLKFRWVDEVDGRLIIHDYIDHAPKYVRDRMLKREQRATRRGQSATRRGQSETVGDSRRQEADSPPPPNQTQPDQTQPSQAGPFSSKDR
jgi:hypothetical protein